MDNKNSSLCVRRWGVANEGYEDSIIPLPSCGTVFTVTIGAPATYEPEGRKITCKECQSPTVQIRCKECFLAHFCNPKCLKQHKSWCRTFREQYFHYQYIVSGQILACSTLPQVCVGMIGQYLLRNFGFFSAEQKRATNARRMLFNLDSGSSPNGTTWAVTQLVTETDSLTFLRESPYTDWIFCGVELLSSPSESCGFVHFVIE